MFTVNNENTRTKSITSPCLYYYFWTCFTTCSSVARQHEYDNMNRQYEYDTHHNRKRFPIWEQICY